MNHYDNGQTVLNDWTAVRVTVEGYENPTYPSGLRFKDTQSCSTHPGMSPLNQREIIGYRL